MADDISPNMQQRVLELLDKQIRRRHFPITNPFTPQHVNRLMYTAEEWRHVSFVDSNMPTAMQRVHYVTFRPSLFGITPPHIRGLSGTLPAAAGMLLSMRTQTNALMVPPLRGTNPPVFNIRSAPVECTFMDRDCKFYPTMVKWVSAQYKVAIENIIAYAVAHEVISQATTWKQVAKALPTLPRVVAAAADLQQYMKGSRLYSLAESVQSYLPPDLVHLTGKGARALPPDLQAVIDEYGDHCASMYAQSQFFPSLSPTNPVKDSIWQVQETRAHYKLYNLFLSDSYGGVAEHALLHC